MTATTTTSATTSTTGPGAHPTGDQASPLALDAGASFPTATAQAARRSILQTFRSPQLLVMPTVLAALFLVIFRYVFGGAIETGERLDYVDYLVPGFLVQTILWTGMNTPAGIAEDAASGVYDRFRSLPIPRAAVVAGRSLADATLITWTLLLTTVLGFAVGFRTHADLGSVLAAFGLMLVTMYVFTWVFITLGLTASNAQAAQGMSSVVVIPLSFVSSAFVPVESMPGWMQPFAAHQPVSVIINAVRSLVLGGTDAAGVGHSSAYWVGVSLAWCAGILVVFSGLAVARFARTR